MENFLAIMASIFSIAATLLAWKANNNVRDIKKKIVNHKGNQVKTSQRNVVADNVAGHNVTNNGK